MYITRQETDGTFELLNKKDRLTLIKRKSSEFYIITRLNKVNLLFVVLSVTSSFKTLLLFF